MRAWLVALSFAASWAGAADRPLVLIFTRTDCPIANRYAPELRRLFNAYAGKADFQLVYVEPGVSEQQIERHRTEYALPIPAIRDKDRKYVRMAAATVTPEAAVFLHGRLVYRGRINNQFVGFGVARNEPFRHDLDEVLASIVAGVNPPLRVTKAIGCAIEDQP
jgi:hypothetical protein